MINRTINKNNQAEHTTVRDILNFSTINLLKTVNRANSVSDVENGVKRKESSAEHSWSSLMLADFYLTKYNYNMNRLKVYDLILYHDLVEVKTGDIALRPGYETIGKKEQEFIAACELREELPHPINQKFWEGFEEFEGQKSMEAKFAKAIDAYDPIIQELAHKEDWKGWTKEFLIKKKAKFFEPFPEIKKSFYETLDYMVKEGYIS